MKTFTFRSQLANVGTNTFDESRDRSFVACEGAWLILSWTIPYQVRMVDLANHYRYWHNLYRSPTFISAEMLVHQDQAQLQLREQVGVTMTVLRLSLERRENNWWIVPEQCSDNDRALIVALPNPRCQAVVESDVDPQTIISSVQDQQHGTQALMFTLEKDSPVTFRYYDTNGVKRFGHKAQIPQLVRLVTVTYDGQRLNFIDQANQIYPVKMTSLTTK